MLKPLKKTFENSIASIILSIVYLLFCFGSAIYFGINARFPQMWHALIGGIFAMPLIYIFEKIFRFEMKGALTFLVLFLASGGLIVGPSYNFYINVPIYDDILHVMSGLIFAVIGYAVSNRLLSGKTESPFWYNVLFALLFSLSIAVIWEMIEWVGTTVFHLDMQEDTIVDNFHSYLLAGSHEHVVDVDNIVKTVIYYGDNQTLVIDGYLDLGLWDTLNDLLCCIIGAIVFFATFAVNKLCKKNLDKAFIVMHTTPFEKPIG